MTLRKITVGTAIVAVLSFTIVLLQGTTSAVYRLAAGNASGYTDSSGNVWQADSGQYCSGGTSYATSTTVTNTLDPTLYQHGLQGNSFSCVFSVPAGAYLITLKFAETQSLPTAGRYFNVSANSGSQLSQINVAVQAGGKFIAYDRQFSLALAAGGNITIVFSQSNYQAMVSAIQIENLNTVAPWLTLGGNIYVPSGNVGIGLSNPAAALHIGAGGRVMFNRPDNADQFAVGYSSNDLALRWNFNNGSPLIVLTSAGVFLVGQGRTTPAFGNSMLEVGGGRTYITANNEQYGLGVLYGNGSGQTPVFIGASNSATPDMILSNNGGTELMRLLTGGGIRIMGLPSADPGAGSKQLWYDPADSNRVKYTP